jgi:hypothetical protein
MFFCLTSTICSSHSKNVFNFTFYSNFSIKKTQNAKRETQNALFKTAAPTTLMQIESETSRMGEDARLRGMEMDPTKKIFERPISS